MATQEMLLINPAPRPSKRKPAKKASAKQIAWRKKFGQMAKAKAKGETVKQKTTRKATRKVTRKAKPARRSTSVVVRTNPIKARRAVSRRKRNPINMSSLSRPMAMLKPAFIGALGATAVNTTLRYAAPYIPPVLLQGKMRYVTQALAAIGLGMLAQRFGVRGAVAAQAAEGALTVALHQAITSVAGSAGMNLGFMSPARVVGRAPQNVSRLMVKPQNVSMFARGTPNAQNVGMYATGRTRR